VEKSYSYVYQMPDCRLPKEFPSADLEVRELKKATNKMV
jgi:hypothetical protein